MSREMYYPGTEQAATCWLVELGNGEKYGFSPQAALNVATQVHTVPAAFGQAMSAVKPRIAVAFHYFNDYDVRYGVYDVHRGRALRGERDTRPPGSQLQEGARLD